MIPDRRRPGAPHVVRVAAVVALAVVQGVAVGAAGAAVANGHPHRAAASARCPWVGSHQPVERRVDEVLARMTLDEKVALVHGIAALPATAGPVYAGVIPAQPRLCLPALHLQDGPAGVGDGFTKVTQLPAPVALAAAWDPSLARRYGDVVGAEQRGKGANVELGPTVNIVRDPRWGRAFESYGEDPTLAGRTAVGFIEGVQAHGVIAQVKHLAAYNVELLRDTPSDDARVDERTLQEIYLPAFERAVHDAGVGSVMCSYNFVNGDPACSSGYLLDQVLHGQWQFPGFVTSDWFATKSVAPAADAGLDMQMPDGCYFGSRLKLAVQQGRVPVGRLDDMVRRILREEFRFGLVDHGNTGSPAAAVATPADAADAAVAREVAEQGTVLLKNTDGVLPLNVASDHTIAVIGTDAGSQAMTAGGGSAAVVASHVVTPYQGILDRARGRAHVVYDDGSSIAGAVAAARGADVALVFAGLFEAEGADLKDISLSAHDNALIAAVAAANPHTVVVLNTGSAVTMPWLSSVAGVLEAWYPGEQDGAATAAVLFGDADAGGRLPVTFPTSIAQGPTASPVRWPGAAGQERYGERLDVGYRWYDATGRAPLFPFGFGLSYTTFRVHGLRVGAPAADGTVAVSVDVTDTGGRAGEDVVQVYLSLPAIAGEPPHRLVGFGKVTLAPHATGHLTWTLHPRDLGFYDTALHQLVAPAGRYRVFVGESSRQLPLHGGFTLPRTVPAGPRTRGPATGVGAGAAISNAQDRQACPEDAFAPTVSGGLSIVGIALGVAN